MTRAAALDKLNEKLIHCKRCPRLVEWREQVAREKVRRHRNETYWGRPIPGFGDPEAEILIWGLAPAAHGANRTGRMFTGDDSGNWLFRALHETGFANQAESTGINDGLALSNVYITSSIHCAPPANKPTQEELLNCGAFMSKELEIFSSAKLIICLGGIAFREYRRHFPTSGVKFGHMVTHQAAGHTLLLSYHPSRQNTNTGKLRWHDWLRVFEFAREVVT